MMARILSSGARVELQEGSVAFTLGCLAAPTSASGAWAAGPLMEGSTVAVTGATGFIGSWVVHTLLTKGFAVRACVRDASTAKCEFLRAMPQVVTGRLTLHSRSDLRAHARPPHRRFPRHRPRARATPAALPAGQPCQSRGGPQQLHRRPHDAPAPCPPATRATPSDINEEGVFDDIFAGCHGVVLCADALMSREYGPEQHLEAATHSLRHVIASVGESQVAAG